MSTVGTGYTYFRLEGVGRPSVNSIVVNDIQKGVIDVSTSTAMVTVGN